MYMVNGKPSPYPPGKLNYHPDYINPNDDVSLFDVQVDTIPMEYQRTHKEFHTSHRAWICLYHRPGSNYKFHLKTDKSYERELSKSQDKCCPNFPRDYSFTTNPPHLKSTSWCELASLNIRFRIQSGFDVLPRTYLLHKLWHEICVQLFWQKNTGVPSVPTLSDTDRTHLVDFLQNNQDLYKTWESQCLLQDYRLTCRTLSYDLNITFFSKNGFDIIKLMPALGDFINPAPCCPYYPSLKHVPNHRGHCMDWPPFYCRPNSRVRELPDCSLESLCMPIKDYVIPMRYFFRFYDFDNPRRTPNLY